MNLRLKKNKVFYSLRISERTRSIFSQEKGAALLLVLIFAVIAGIVVSVYLLYQLSINKNPLSSAISFQALCNARSGVLKTIHVMKAPSSQSDTMKTINTLDSLFGKSLFTGTIQSDTDTLFEFGKGPQDVQLYSSDQFGTCKVSLFPSGGYCMISSTGTFHSRQHKVIARLGALVPRLNDTVAIVGNSWGWNGATVKAKVDTATLFAPGSSSSRRLNHLETYYMETLADNSDTGTDSGLTMNMPLEISSDADLEKVPAMVKGTLIVNGEFHDLKWNGNNRIITVLGDFQCTGTSTIENMQFIVGGEIKVYDKAQIKRASFFSHSRIFIGDQAHLMGCDLMSDRRIIIYGNAIVDNKSSLVVNGRQLAGPAGPSTQGTKQVAGTGGKTNSAGMPHDSEDSSSSQFSILISESSTFDGVAVALGKPGAIKTDQGTIITGVLWAENSVCHGGDMMGLIRAGKFSSCTSVGAQVSSPASKKDSLTQINTMSGNIKPLETINEYALPFFMDPLHIIAWKED